MTLPGAEEEQRLEERVGDQMEDAADERADAQRQEHVAQLADRGVGEHLLDVVLVSAMVAAKKAVNAPTRRRRISAIGRVAKRGFERAIR